MVFEGKLGMEFVNPGSQLPLQFTAEGWLTIGRSGSVVRGTGDFYPIGNNSDFSCLLSLTINLDLNELNLDLPIAGFSSSRNNKSPDTIPTLARLPSLPFPVLL